MRAFLIAVVAVVVGCGGGKSTPTATPEPAPTNEVQPAAAEEVVPAAESPLPGFDRPWSQLERSERIRLMRDRIVPLGEALFTQLDAEKYDMVDCTTCHGDRALDAEYSMPNPDLIVLDFRPGSGYQKLVAEMPHVIDFMKNRLTPELATALGKEQWAEDNPGGFGCWSCHLKAE